MDSDAGCEDARQRTQEYVGDVVNDGDGEDENDDEAPEDTRDKGSSEADEKQKERHLYEYCGHDVFIEGDAERRRKRLKLMWQLQRKILQMKRSFQEVGQCIGRYSGTVSLNRYRY